MNSFQYFLLFVVLMTELPQISISASPDPFRRAEREAPLDPHPSSLPPPLNVKESIGKLISPSPSSTTIGPSSSSTQPLNSQPGTNTNSSGKRTRPNFSVDFNSRPADGVMVIKPKGPDENYDPPKHSQGSESQEGGGGSDEDEQVLYGAQPKFDDKAVERALLVASVVGGMIIVYLGVKFVLLKKRKVSNKRYGRIESEIDLLDEVEDGETDEEEELFDINSTRRSQQY